MSNPIKAIGSDSPVRTVTKPPAAGGLAMDEVIQAVHFNTPPPIQSHSVNSIKQTKADFQTESATIVIHVQEGGSSAVLTKMGLIEYEGDPNEKTDLFIYEIDGHQYGVSHILKEETGEIQYCSASKKLWALHVSGLLEIERKYRDIHGEESLTIAIRGSENHIFVNDKDTTINAKKEAPQFYQTYFELEGGKKEHLAQASVNRTVPVVQKILHPSQKRTAPTAAIAEIA